MAKDIKGVDTKKRIRKDVVAQLQTALAYLKPLLGDKKFENRIKKAAKLLSEGIAEPTTETKKAEIAEPIKKVEPMVEKPKAKVAAPKAKVAKKAVKKAAVKK